MPKSKIRKQSKKNLNIKLDREKSVANKMWKRYRIAYENIQTETENEIKNLLLNLTFNVGNISSGPTAEQHALALHKQLEILFIDKAQVCGPYEWFWYLRRVPTDIVRGKIATTGAYDLLLAQTSASVTKRKDRDWIEFKGQFAFRTGVEDLEPVMSLLLVAQYMSRVQRLLRRIGKGQAIRVQFDDFIPELIHDKTIDAAIQIYDSRTAKPRQVDAGAGTVIFEKFDDKVPGIPILTAYPDYEGWVPTPAGQSKRLAAFHIVLASLNPLKSLLDSASSSGYKLSLPAISFLSAMVSTALIAPSEPNVIHQIESTGYLILPKVETQSILAETRKMLVKEWGVNLFSHPEATGAEMLGQLENLPIEFMPWTGGKPAVELGDEKVLLDFHTLTRRLNSQVMLTDPSGGGLVNHRGFHFEEMIQDLFSDTVWSPSDKIRSYRGKTLKLNGKDITDIDAIGLNENFLLIISAKSMPYSTAMDAGLFREVRNSSSTVHNAIKKWSSVVQILSKNPIGDNYDFSGFNQIIGIVITPNAIYTSDQSSLEIVAHSGDSVLRMASSVGELQSFLLNSSTSWIMNDLQTFSFCK